MHVRSCRLSAFPHDRLTSAAVSLLQSVFLPASRTLPAASGPNVWRADQKIRPAFRALDLDVVDGPVMCRLSLVHRTSVFAIARPYDNPERPSTWRGSTLRASGARLIEPCGMDKETRELRRKIKAKRTKRGEFTPPDDPCEAMLDLQRGDSRSTRDRGVVPGSFENGKRR
jgi:hypothetical protein